MWIIDIFHVFSLIVILLPSFPLPSPVVSLLEHLRHILVDGPVRAFAGSAFVPRQLKKENLNLNSRSLSGPP